jgi:hypothetical protein
MTIDLDVIIDRGADGFPVGYDIALRWQRLQRWAVDGGIQRCARTFPLAERPVVEPFQQCGDGFVQFRQREELLVA